jgi:transcriptional regulator with XRE-family HTH domain
MFWERFVSECDLLGVKPNPAAKEMGISSATLTKWSKGVMPTAKSLNKVAAYFGVTSDYLLGNTNERTVPDEKLEGIDFALSGEIKTMTNNEKQDLLDYILFKKKQKEERTE